MKNNRGISLVAIIASVVILTILTGTIVITSTSSITNAKKAAFASEISQIQNLVDVYKYQKDVYPITTNSYNIVTALPSGSYDTTKENAQTKLFEIDYTLINLSKLSIGTKADGNTNDVYVVSNTSGIVYYLKGKTLGSTTYYRLTDDLQKYIKINNLTQQVSGTNNVVNLNDGISITLNTTSWTNQPIIATVNIPTSGVNVNSITATKATAGTNPTVTGPTNNQYTINGNSITDNYVINITYNTTKTVRYDVTNFDNVVPVINDSTIISVKNSITNDYSNYLPMTTSDLNSGVKIVKWEVGDLTTNESNLYSYFKTYNKGNILQNKSGLEIGTEQYYTIYVEDYAGNYTYKKITNSAYLNIPTDINTKIVTIPKTAGTISSFFRIGTLPIATSSSLEKDLILDVVAVSGGGAVTTSTIYINIAQNASNPNDTSVAAQISCFTSHSYNSAVTSDTESSWVLYSARISHDGTNWFLDLRRNRYTNTSDVTIYITPRKQTAWKFSKGQLTAEVSGGAYESYTQMLYEGLIGDNIAAATANTANYSTTANYSNYGVTGATTSTDATDKTGKWVYFGNIVMLFNSAYTGGQTYNGEILLREVSPTKDPSLLENITLDMKVLLPSATTSAIFNTTVPSISVLLKGTTTLTRK